MSINCDVLIIGGGPAGLAAATTLARALWNVVVVDDGHQRNASSSGAHDVLGHDGIAPRELVAKGRAEAESYGATFIDTRVETIAAEHDIDPADGFIEEYRFVATAGKESVTARRVILATGLKDVLPQVKGLERGWGRWVLHCPYCHGLEARGKKIAVIGDTPGAVHQALLFTRYSDDITLYLDGINPGAQERELLEAAGIDVVPHAITRVRDNGGELTLTLGDGSSASAQVITCGPKMEANAELYTALGGVVQPHEMGSFVPIVDPSGRTPVPGVFVAGNATNLGALVMAAAASGATAAAAVNGELIIEDL